MDPPVPGGTGHLEQGVALARRFGRPFLEFSGLAYLAAREDGRSGGRLRTAEHCRQAIELAQRHGWTDEPAAGIAYRTLGVVLAWQGRPEEAEPLVQRAERTVTPEIEPGAAMGVCFARAALELARGRDHDALAAVPGRRAAGRAPGHTGPGRPASAGTAC